MTDLEHRSGPIETKLAPGDTGLIGGYASLFNAPDAVGDVIAPGAFTRSIREHKAAGTAPLMLWQHDLDEPIGRWTSFDEDERGLRVEGRLVLESAKGADAYQLVKAGALNGLSIGFRVRDSERRRGGGRLIRALELVEISLVSLPAASRARVDAVKSTAASRAASTEESDMTDETTLAAGDEAAHADEGGRLVALETRMEDFDQRLAALDGTVGSVKKATSRIETRLNRPGAALETKADEGDLTKKAFNVFIRRGAQALGPDERKALNTSDDSAMVPEGFRAELVRNLVELSPIRAFARVTPTATNELRLPKRTAEMAAAWEGETDARAGTEPTYAQLVFPVHTLAAHVDVSQAMLEDSALDLEAELARDLAEAFAYAEGVAFVSGSGTGEPEGILAAADGSGDDGTIVDATSSTALDADEIIDVAHGVKAAYRRNAVWGMNRSTMAAVRKLKDGQGNYIWQESLAANNPPTIAGRPVVEVPAMPDIATGQVPIFFADLGQGYRIAERVSLSVLRDPYSQGANGLVRYHARRRVGGGIAKGEAFSFLKMA